MSEETSAPLTGSDKNKLIGYLLHQVDRDVFKRQNEALKPYNINFHCACTLNYIVANEGKGSINQRALENFTSLTNPAITKIVNTLVDMGLVQRLIDESDRRNHSLVATDKGRELNPIFNQLSIQTDADCFACLPAAERASLVKVLKKLNESR